MDDGLASLRDELIGMAAEDEEVRERLARDGSLFDRYHPRMEEVHRRNGARLEAIIERHGWPGRSLVGEEGARAAWLVLQHAISLPDLQRRGLRLLREAVNAGEAHPQHAAMLEDRIRVFEGRPQIYGTQFDWDEEGRMSPLPIEDPGGVAPRRGARPSRRRRPPPPRGDRERAREAARGLPRAPPPDGGMARGGRMEALGPARRVPPPEAAGHFC